MDSYNVRLVVTDVPASVCLPHETDSQWPLEMPYMVLTTQ